MNAPHADHQHRIAMALTGAGVMLTFSLISALLFVVPAERMQPARKFQALLTGERL